MISADNWKAAIIIVILTSYLFGWPAHAVTIVTPGYGSYTPQQTYAPPPTVYRQYAAPEPVAPQPRHYAAPQTQPAPQQEGIYVNGRFIPFGGR